MPRCIEENDTQDIKNVHDELELFLFQSLHLVGRSIPRKARPRPIQWLSDFRQRQHSPVYDCDTTHKARRHPDQSSFERHLCSTQKKLIL